MDTINLEDLNITVKTLTVNTKKITKTFLQQLPIQICVYHSKNDTKYIGCGEDEDYIINGSLICWVNLPPTNSFSPYLTANKWKGIPGYPDENCLFSSGSLYFALFLNNKNQLRITVIDTNTIRKFKLEQIFI